MSDKLCLCHDPEGSNCFASCRDVNGNVRCKILKSGYKNCRCKFFKERKGRKNETKSN